MNNNKKRGDRHMYNKIKLDIQHQQHRQPCKKENSKFCLFAILSERNELWIGENYIVALDSDVCVMKHAKASRIFITLKRCHVHVY